jgi:hypothetical protein
MMPEGGQWQMNLCHLCMASFGFVNCVVGDKEELENEADDLPIQAIQIHPHQVIC